MMQRYADSKERSVRAATPRAPAPIPAAQSGPGGLQRTCACGGGCPRCVVSGEPLAAPIRSMMESRLGAPLSTVRLHTDRRAQEAARQRGANAFTLGSDIYFAAGKFAPDTQEGMTRLAHELVHVEQQRAGTRVSTHTANDASEQEARDLGAAAAAGQHVHIRAAAPLAMQRDEAGSDAKPGANQLKLDPEIEALALRHFIRWWLGTALVEHSAPTQVAESGDDQYSTSVPEAGLQMPTGLPMGPFVFQLPLRSTMFDPLPPDPLYIRPDVGSLFSGFSARGAPVGEGDSSVVFDIYRRNQAIAAGLPDLRALAPGFLRTLIPGTWRRDIAGALTGAAVGSYLKRDYMTPIEVSDRAWEAMTGAGTTMIPFPSFSF